MHLKELIRLNKFELSLMLARAISEERGIPMRLQKPEWTQALSHPSLIQKMAWDDFTEFRASVVKAVWRQLKKSSALGKKVREIVCDDFKLCQKLGFPASVLSVGIASALKDYFGATIADLITAILIAHVSLSVFCRCDLRPDG